MIHLPQTKKKPLNMQILDWSWPREMELRSWAVGIEAGQGERWWWRRILGREGGVALRVIVVACRRWRRRRVAMVSGAHAEKREENMM